ncbi:MAG: type VI secretion system tip protein TssI/VgrG [Chthoniobacterales bacterium]
MPTFSQANRALQVTTPLGQDALLVTGFRGAEQLSHLFSFELDLVADNATQVDFNKIVGNEITLQIAIVGQGGSGQSRFINGICVRFSEGDRNEQFTSYSAEVVPKVWLLSRLARSRIFQQKSVPDILKAVLQGFDCGFQLRGQYEPREYCVQYRETDLNFASRLMEEEGIYYFFEHSDGRHQMIVADTPQSHSDVPGLTTVNYDVVVGGSKKADHVYSWEKTQALRASKYTLRDHTFEQPTQNLEAKENILDSVQAGTVQHQLKDQANAPLEIYDFPGGYADRFDGVSPSGGDQPARLQKIFEDNKRTVKLRMEAEALPSLTIEGSSLCSNFVAGHKFTLARHFDGDGNYVLVSVTHDASIGDAFRTGSTAFSYSNSFTCIPLQLPYRPERRTPKPFIAGFQSALVTGPAGKEIFTDKFGRVKVQFFWDREGKNDENSSCWIRVAQSFAGKRWGSSFWPRLGQEVLVTFEEGDPDRPIIVGSVYNAEQMPPYLGDGLDSKHKNDPNVSGIKTNTTLGGVGFNEIRFDDTKGKEQMFLHAEKNLDVRVKGEKHLTIGGDLHISVGFEDKDGGLHGAVVEDVYKDKQTHVGEEFVIYADQSHILSVGKNGQFIQVIDGEEGKCSTVVQQRFSLKTTGEVVIEALEEICLTCGPSFIKLTPAGIFVTGPLVNINSGGASSPADDLVYQPPSVQATLADDSKSGQKSAR